MKIVLFVYALLLAVGGYIGYAQAGSKMSLIMGMISSVVVLIGIVLSKSNQVLGYGIVGGMALILVITFAVRLAKTHALMPSGLMLFFSIIALVISILILIKK